MPPVDLSQGITGAREASENNVSKAKCRNTLFYAFVFTNTRISVNVRKTRVAMMEQDEAKSKKQE